MSLHPDATPRRDAIQHPIAATRGVSHVIFLALFLLSTFTPPARADLTTCAQKLHTGDYVGCIDEARKAIDEGQYHEDWRHHAIRAHLAVGSYEDARTVLEQALSRYHSSIRIRVLGHDVYMRLGQREKAAVLLEQINTLVTNRPWWYTDAPDLVAQGKATLLLEADPRQVLQLLYDRAKKETPGYRDTYLAVGQLALNKHDYAEAAKAFGDGVKRFPQDADLWFGIAQAYAPSDDVKTTEALAKTLELNPNHTGAMLMRADNLIDGEHYEEAGQWLGRALGVNPSEPTAWAYTAVIAHLDNDAAGEAAARERALRYWKTNPLVEHVIGRKLSAKYRFAEGAASQRKSLTFDPNYLAAKMQLAQDLLRLGEVEEGWRLAKEVHQKDGFNVVAYNLITLQDNIAKFTSLENEHFIVRMDAREASIYGDRVLDLLNRARSVLCDKYGMTLKERVTVEIFPDQKDFAIRTFGLPGGSGYLGVCFGKVITANSPAALKQNTANWEAVLWHEFCHVVTLQATRNRMPRWLSEGISVYEEQQANKTWGQAINPTYRRMILEGELTPVGQLSAAFLRAKSALHLQFAYYESSLVVEYIIETAGLDAMRKILSDLHTGIYINEALAKHISPVATLEKDFEAWARKRAEAVAPDADWEPLPKEAVRGGPALDAWLKEHPQSFAGLMLLAGRQFGQEKYDDAKTTLNSILTLYPDYAGDDSALVMLAAVHQQLKETDAEYAVLVKFASLNADHVPTFVRLMELAAAREDWPAVQQYAQRMLAVNPLVSEPWRRLATAAEYRGDHAQAAKAYRVLLQMEPADPAQAHYDLARHLHALGDPQAKRQVLMALEEAPRFREAQKLLLAIRAAQPQPVKPPAPVPPDTHAAPKRGQ
ncbi:MAG: tetratricopeptide repeat protein [Phycisphaeraceae bacterium]